MTAKENARKVWNEIQKDFDELFAKYPTKIIDKSGKSFVVPKVRISVSKEEYEFIGGLHKLSNN